MRCRSCCSEKVTTRRRIRWRSKADCASPLLSSDGGGYVHHSLSHLPHQHHRRRRAHHHHHHHHHPQTQSEYNNLRYRQYSRQYSCLRMHSLPDTDITTITTTTISSSSFVPALSSSTSSSPSSPSLSSLLAVVSIVLIFLISVTTAFQQAVFADQLSALTNLDFDNAERLSKEEIYRPAERSLEEVNRYRSDIRAETAERPPDGGPRPRHRRNGVSRPAKMWPHGRIPYAISSHYSPHERALLARAVKQYHDKTCVRFVPRTAGEADYLFIGKVDGCFSEVGRTSGIQVLSLDNGCMEYSTIIHEIMHVVGFYHEHERWDRDQYIDIIWQNIDRGALDQFGKVDLSKTSYYGQPYDYKSILHYDSLAFSRNGYPTMLPKQNGFATTIGNAKDFSEVDLAKINRMYRCDNYIAINNNNNNNNQQHRGAAIFPVQPTSSFGGGGAKAQVAPIYAPPSKYVKEWGVSGGQSHYYQPNNGRPPVGGHQLAVLNDDNEEGDEYGAEMDGFVNHRQPLQQQQQQQQQHHRISNCEDRITVCWWTQDRCLSPNIYLMMKTLCPKTCKFC